VTRYGITSVTGTPPTITFPLLLAGSVGALLIYCAVVGKTPPEVLKEVMTNQPAATGGLGNYTRPNTPTGNARSTTGGAGSGTTGGGGTMKRI
jgi:hypothetical protein